MAAEVLDQGAAPPLRDVGLVPREELHERPLLGQGDLLHDEVRANAVARRAPADVVEEGPGRALYHIMSYHIIRYYMSYVYVL